MGQVSHPPLALLCRGSPQHRRDRTHPHPAAGPTRGSFLTGPGLEGSVSALGAWFAEPDRQWLSVYATGCLPRSG